MRLERQGAEESRDRSQTEMTRGRSDTGLVHAGLDPGVTYAPLLGGFEPGAPISQVVRVGAGHQGFVLLR